MSYRAVVLTLALAVPLSGFAATPCPELASLKLANTTITLAQIVSAGSFTPPAGARGGPQQFAELPEFCRVQATLRPSADSDIKMELWMPAASRWNGKFRGTGNGGLGGGATVNAGPLATGIRLGYATAGNNTGHEGDSSYALSQPEKIKDFGYRSAHEMTVTSKALIKAYYDKPLQYSVMAEGGGGTIAALSSAQRYPEDYDIIAVTGMSSHLSRHTAAQMWVWYATHKDEASFIPPDKYPVLHKAALDACDAKDGLKDGLISDPEHCKFDPGVVQCKRCHARLSDCRSGGSCAKDLRRASKPTNKGRDLFAALSRQRVRLGTVGRRRPAAGNSRGVLQILCVQGSELGLQDAAGELRQRYRVSRSCRDCGRQCRGSGSPQVLRSRREAVARRGLERCQRTA